jgi:hypothetical protein
MYLLDYIYGSFFRTYKVTDSLFSRLDCGVELTFEHPTGFVTDVGGCTPRLHRTERAM